MWFHQMEFCWFIVNVHVCTVHCVCNLSSRMQHKARIRPSIHSIDKHKQTNHFCETNDDHNKLRRTTLQFVKNFHGIFIVSNGSEKNGCVQCCTNQQFLKLLFRSNLVEILFSFFPTAVIFFFAYALTHPLTVYFWPQYFHHMMV